MRFTQKKFATFNLIISSLFIFSGCASGQPQVIDEETQAAARESVYGTVGEYSKERSDQALARWSSSKDEFSGTEIYDPPTQDREWVEGDGRDVGALEVFPRVAVIDGDIYLAWSVSFSGFSWMFMDEVLVRVDDETLSFPVEPSSGISRDLGGPRDVVETSIAAFSDLQLDDYRKLADSSSARLRVSGSDKTIDRDFTAAEMKLIREARDIYLALKRG